jgi:hypothetical protein
MQATLPTGAPKQCALHHRRVPLPAQATLQARHPVHPQHSMQASACSTRHISQKCKKQTTTHSSPLSCLQSGTLQLRYAKVIARAHAACHDAHTATRPRRYIKIPPDNALLPHAVVLVSTRIVRNLESHKESASRHARTILSPGKCPLPAADSAAADTARSSQQLGVLGLTTACCAEQDNSHDMPRPMCWPTCRAPHSRGAQQQPATLPPRCDTQKMPRQKMPHCIRSYTSLPTRQRLSQSCSTAGCLQTQLRLKLRNRTAATAQQGLHRPCWAAAPTHAEPRTTHCSTCSPAVPATATLGPQHAGTGPKLQPCTPEADPQ